MKRTNWTWRFPGVSKLWDQSGHRSFRRFFTTPRAGYLSIVVGVAVLLLLGGIMAADSPSDTPAPGVVWAEPTVPTAASQPIEQSVEPAPNDLEFRAGWWWGHNSGSQLKVGEWQGLKTSDYFLDVDTLRGNGDRTVDFFATGTETDSTKVGLHFYGGPRVSASMEYDRFLHRLDHMTPNGFYDGSFSAGELIPTPPFVLAPAIPANGSPYPVMNNQRMYAQDLNAGQDYAIRVQEFKANFKGNITEDLSWGLRVFGMEKEGMRQAKSMSHCYTLNASTVLAEGVDQLGGQPATGRCHLLSQSQRIDWMTVEVEPYIAYQLTDSMRLEYSRTMRSFEQGDQRVFRTSNGGGAIPGTGVNELAPYAFVPESITDIDRLKFSAEIGDYTNAYVLGYIGNNTNEFRDTNRHFSGVDARVSNNAIEGLQVVGYGKTYQTQTSNPTQALNAQYGSTQWGEPTLPDFDAIDRQYNAFGLTNRWKPFHDESDTLRGRMTLLGGYEYGTIDRQPSEFDVPPLTFVQPSSRSHKLFVGATEKWSKELQTTVKQTFISTYYPMYGVTPIVSGTDDPGTPVGNAVNTMLPTAQDRLEITNTWQPADNFMLNATFFIENSNNRSHFARFEEDSYPFVLSGWYAPSNKWSFSAGYAQLTDWIDQDIILGSTQSTATVYSASPTYTAPWRFGGKSDVMNLGATYAWTERLSLSSGFEYVYAANAFVPAAPLTTNNANAAGNGPGAVYTPAPYTDIAQMAMVKVNTYRLTAGVDYLWRPRSSVFCRYVYYNYDDIGVAANTGESHMFLTGVSATF